MVDWARQLTEEEAFSTEKISPRQWLKMVEEKLLPPFIWLPLKGQFGLYYGNVNSMRQEIVDKGQLTDPNSGLDFPLGYLHQESMLKVSFPTKASASCSGYNYTEINQLFSESAAKFRELKESLGSNGVFLLLSPLPDFCADDVVRQNILKTRDDVRELLGLPQDRVVNAPVALPTALFSSISHLNRHGRILYTAQIGTILGRLLQKTYSVSHVVY
jgi:hypothetical protein